MTKVLVTGLTSRQCNPAKNKRDVMVSWLIAEVCRDLGYEVEHRNPTIEESYEEFDHVFLGMAPLHGLGSNRSYGSLSCYLKTYGEGKVTLYQDDDDNAKVTNGIRTVNNDPARLTKRYFDYKLEYDLANTPKWNSWLMSGVSTLADYAWPTTIIPAFQWADLEQLTRACPNLVDPLGIDFTAYLPDHGKGEEVRKQQWVAELYNREDERWFARQRAQWFTQRFGKGYDKRPEDLALFQWYGESWGVLNRGNTYGWWNSRIGMAAAARTLYVTNWQSVETLGDSYALLPDTVEELTPEQRIDWAEAQAEALAANIEDKETVKDKIRKLVEK